MIRVPVPLPDQPYEVLVGAGARHRLLEVLPVGAERAAVVTQADIGVPVDPGVEHEVFLLDDGEEAKSLESVEELCRRFSRWGLTRRDVVVAVGGGVVTDTAGFAAAVYHRGVRVVHVPTTLLGQVDAAIGGKTGVNLPEGKNLVGAFWQPSAVLCDTEVLATLPPREYTSRPGRDGQVPLPDRHRHGRPAPRRAGGRVRAHQGRAGRTGRHRAAASGPSSTTATPWPTPWRPPAAYDLRHGEAVAIGLVFAAAWPGASERIDDDRVAEHRRVVEGYGLPTTVDGGLDPGALVDLMRRDKKALDGLTFVLDGPRGPEVVTGVDDRHVLSALEQVRA